MNPCHDVDDNALLSMNLELTDHRLRSMIDSKNADSFSSIDSMNSQKNTANVLREIQHTNLSLNDANAPEFEFHGYGCEHSMGTAPKEYSGAKKKKPGYYYNNNQMHENSNNSGCSYVSEQQENVWRPVSCIGSGNNLVLRLMKLFTSLHEEIIAELPSHQPNSMPSDYVYEIPRRSSMPHGLNMRHHIQVMCTKLERFLTRLRRMLDANRTFDYIKHRECHDLLEAMSDGINELNQFKIAEFRHRYQQFISRVAKENAQKLEQILLALRDQVKAAHIYVHVFNWEMDQEHRYSSAMTLSKEATNQLALSLAEADIGNEQPRPLTAEEQFIAEHYQLENVMHCAKEHDDFLTALLKSPETYFPPEIIALCEPPKHMHPVNAVQVDEVSAGLEQLYLIRDIVELQPSSPPRANQRRHIVRWNHS